MKILHLSFHLGCANAIKSVLDILDIELTTKIVTSGDDCYYYNMTEDRANNAWETHKDFYNKFDVIIISDTALLSRIFLQNDYKGKLIIYICNRFDYWDSREGRSFPDEKYYQLMRNAWTKSNVYIAAYTLFDLFYAGEKGVLVHEIINPVSKPYIKSFNKERYYIPTYSNDTLLNLYDKCLVRGIEVITGRYKDRDALAHFKAIIHLPYSWSSIALFDALAVGCAYYVPTKEFLLKLIQVKDYWFQNVNYCKEHLYLSDFYQKENSIFVKYFNSFEELYDIEVNSDEIYKEAELLFNLNQKKWINILNS